jgi:2-methylisocitrate lyase-like PEP mutase family enzyme
MISQINKTQKFLEMHRSPSILVLPNAWDVASARIFEQAGFGAIGTTSAGIAASLGYREPERISRDEMLQTVKRIIDSVQLPVSVDIEAGYSSTSEGVGETVKMMCHAGAVGINLEDSPGIDDQPLQEIEAQVERIKVARQAAQLMNCPLVINARTDIYLFGVGNPETRFGEVVKRANAYLNAGADCVFVPGVGDSKIIASLVNEIHGPINILANTGVPAIQQLQELGVARVSLGSGPMRATLGLIRRISQELFTSGTYDTFTTNTIPYSEVNQFF